MRRVHLAYKLLSCESNLSELKFSFFIYKLQQSNGLHQGNLEKATTCKNCIFPMPANVSRPCVVREVHLQIPRLYREYSQKYTFPTNPIPALRKTFVSGRWAR